MSSRIKQRGSPLDEFPRNYCTEDFLQKSVSHYLINGTIFGGKKVTEHKIYVLIFSTTFA